MDFIIVFNHRAKNRPCFVLSQRIYSCRIIDTLERAQMESLRQHFIYLSVVYKALNGKFYVARVSHSSHTRAILYIRLCCPCGMTACPPTYDACVESLIDTMYVPAKRAAFGCCLLPCTHDAGTRADIKRRAADVYVRKFLSIHINIYKIKKTHTQIYIRFCWCCIRTHCLRFLHMNFWVTQCTEYICIYAAGMLLNPCNFV